MGKVRKGIKLVPYDPADYLDSDEAIACYLEAAQEDADPKAVEMARANIERARLRNQKQKPAPHS